MELKRRKIIHVAVTDSPTDEWTAQQLREATAWGEKPEYLIRDWDSKYGALFSNLAFHTGIQVLKTPYRTPKANSFCERFMGSLRRECLDHFVFFNRNHVNRVTKEYVVFFNGHRPHQGIQQRIPEFDDNPPRIHHGKIRTAVFLGGLHHSYLRGNAPP